jgi:hypothetical protein
VTWRGLLTSATTRTFGAIESIVITVRIDFMSASLLPSRGNTSAAAACMIPARSRSRESEASPFT